MTIRYYDKEGKRISLMQWGQLMEFPDYRIVATDDVDGRHVSTVWLGLDHSLNLMGIGPPLIFETMVFPECTEMERYSTMEQAIEGHRLMVERVKQRRDEP